MNEIRCGACSRKLGAGEFTVLQIKCPRCGTINHLRAESPSPERPRASRPKGDDHGQTSPHGRQGPPTRRERV
ncbi:Com family DNA-binding transcriptional regulator [Hydrogenophaga sp. NH-16]|uniref:Com family DNA-binding transcriptional regulator n=1 Tax=Hydrogenophaga sp. NH-16 TaxID=2184519 RepID=UPI000FD76683|nr:Com family DNA-binding transcriptional regulator [Hydrogenophaga sp. NH-16]